jgi:hypothetical protein
VWAAGDVHFFSTSTGRTINTNGVTLQSGVVINGVGGGWQLQGALTCNSSFTLTAGALGLNNFTVTARSLLSTNANVRSIAFGTGQFTVTGDSSTDSRIVDFGTFTNFTYTGTYKIVSTSTSSNGISVNLGFLSEAAAPNLSTNLSTGFIFNSARTGFVSYFAAVNNIDTTGYAGVFGIASSSTIFGSLVIGATTTLSSGGVGPTFAATSGTKTITTNGKTLDVPVSFSGVGGTFQLQDALTTGATRTTTLQAGALNLNGFTLTTGQFSASSSSVRAIAFGTGNITVVGSGTVWNTSTTTNFSRTGTPTVNVSNNSATATTVQTGSLSEAQALDFNYTTGTYTLTDTSARYRNLNLTGFGGTFNAGTSNRTLFGGFNAGTTATLTAGTSGITFAATSGTWDINGNGRTCDFPLTFNGVGGTWRLQSALTSGAARTATLTNGTLDLNGFTFTTGFFSSSNSNVRTIAFGTGNITVIGAGGSATAVWAMSTATNFTRTGTPTVNVSNNSATASRVDIGAFTQANALDFNYTTGTYTLDETSGGANPVYRSVNLTGFAGTFPNNPRTYFGGFNAGSTATISAGDVSQTFSATSGTWNITRNGRTLDFPFTFNGIGGTWQLQDNLTTGAARNFTLTNGTLDINSQTTSVGIFTLPATTSRAITNGTLTCASVTHTAGAFAVGTGYNINSTGTYTFTAGTLTINDGVTLPVGAFISSNSNVRTIAFGTGQISVSGNNTTIWDISDDTNLLLTGTFRVVATYSGAVGTRTVTGPFSEPNSQPLSTSGSSGIIFDTVSTDIKSLSGGYTNFDLTGMLGTLANVNRRIYGNFNAGSTITIASGSTQTNFVASSGTKTITSNGRTLGFPFSMGNFGSTYQLQDALNLGASGITFFSGTFDANNYNVTVATVGCAPPGIPINLGSGTWTVTGSGFAWSFSSGSTATLTGAATISMTSASAKTFGGGGVVYPTLNQGGAGALTISGNNTFTNITSTQTSTSACTITLTASSTQTLTNLTASGTSSANLLTFNSSTNGTRANLVVNNDVNLSFTSLRDNRVSGGFRYSALLTNGNVNVSNNAGWQFSLGGGSFISFF